MENISEKEPKEIKKEKLSEKVVEELYAEKKEELKKRELLAEEEKIIREKLEKEVARMNLSPKLQDDAKKRAQQIVNLDEKGKLKRLLDLAEEKGVAFAVDVAKKMDDAAILDYFHDILARDGLYKNLPR
jgi:hypothetical protein